MAHPDNLLARWFSAELLVAHLFAVEGYTIAVPLAPCAYDLIVDAHGFLYRVQVKTLSWRLPRSRRAGKGDRACYATGLTHTNGKRRGACEFDILTAVCTPTRIYVFPEALLHSPSDNTRLLRDLRIKLPGDRADTNRAAARWEPYLNQFKLGEVGETG